MTFDDIKQLIEAANFNKDFSKTSTNDGRISSAESESDVIFFLKEYLQKYNIKVESAPQSRFWYDCSFVVDNKFYPINIKISSGENADNVSSKEGMYYALTGIDAKSVRNEGNLIQWGNFITSLLKHYNPNNDEDYYILVCFKDTKNFLFTSLKRLPKLVPNGNNLPFQCRWSEAKTPSNRNQQEQCKYILNTFIDGYTARTPNVELLIDWRKNNE